MSDLSLKFSDREFRVHKAIPAACSVDFKSMFKKRDYSKTDERIDDIYTNDLSSILKYIYYAEKYYLNSEKALKLYPAFHKYKISNLETLCSEYLETHLTADNAVDIIELADKFENLTLKNSVLKYIHAECEQLLNTERWRRLQSENDKLSSKIMSAISSGK